MDHFPCSPTFPCSTGGLQGDPNLCESSSHPDKFVLRLELKPLTMAAAVASSPTTHIQVDAANGCLSRVLEVEGREFVVCARRLWPDSRNITAQHDHVASGCLKNSPLYALFTGYAGRES